MPKPTGFRMPAGVAVAVAGVLVCLWLLSNSTLREGRDTAIAAAVGLALYWLNRIRKAAALR